MVIGAVASHLRSLSPFVALCTLNPEPWCVVVIRPGARETVGLFNNGSAPLQAWLLQAALAGKRIRIEDSKDLVSNEVWSRSEMSLPALCPAAPHANRSWLKSAIQQFDLGRPGKSTRSRTDAVALMAGLWQMNDFLDQSHEAAQSVEGEGRHCGGDYWHAILHRREPDYGNAKYWFRRVGKHPIHANLLEHVPRSLTACSKDDAERWGGRLTKNGWDPLAFVDLCEFVADAQNAELACSARQLQFLEMTMLLAQTYRDATA